MSHEDQELLQEVAALAESYRDLSGSDVDKVAAALGRWCKAHPGGRRALQNKGAWKSYIRTALWRACSKHPRRPQMLRGDEGPQTTDSERSTPLEVEDAQLLILALRPLVGDDGNFAIDVLVSGRGLRDVAASAQITRAVAHEHFKKGVEAIHNVALRLARGALGASVLDEFLGAVALLKDSDAVWTTPEACLPHRLDASDVKNDSVDEGHAVNRRLRQYRIRHGQLRYRQQLVKLSPMAQRVVWMFESGARPAEIIDALARGVIGAGGRPLTGEERQVGEQRFVQMVGQIREILDA